MRYLRALIGLRAVCLLAAAGSSGCLATPKPASSIVPVVYRTSHYPADPASAGKYWKHDGPSGAVAVLQPGRVVAITEFDVEMVDLQVQSGFGPQAAFKLPPLVLGPFTPLMGIGFGLQLSGLGRRNARLDAAELQRLSAGLLGELEDDLRGRGLIVVDRGKLAACDGYAALKTKPAIQSSPLMLMNLAGSDTGFVMHSRTVAAPGMGVVTARAAKRREAERQILSQAGADLALAVRLRVGIFRGKGALEEGSTIRVVSAGGETTLTAQHSILSDLDVIGSRKFRLIVGEVEPVMADDFARELSSMLPLFLNLALADSAPRKADSLATSRLPPVDPPDPTHP